MQLDRRAFIAAGSALALPASGRPSRATPDIYQEALTACFPLYETARLAMASPTPFNQIGHRRALADHNSRGVTMPNNDTLYSACWMDLTTGPLTLTLPAPTGRYQSVALMSAFTDNVAVLRLPTSSTQELSVQIVGPDWDAPDLARSKTIRLPSSYGWLLARTFVKGIDDLPGARAAQDGLSLVANGHAASQLRLQPATTTQPDGAMFLTAVNAAIPMLDRRSPLRSNLRKFARIGVGDTEARAWDMLSTEAKNAWNGALRRLSDGSIGKMEAFSSSFHGWNWPNANIGAFRAAVALSGIGALPQSEAIYLRAVSDAEGRPLSADGRYRLTLPSTAQIAGAFWSLTAYRGEPDGRYFFQDNSVHRYAVNSASTGLTTDRNGHIPLVIQKERPADASTNWLPMPTEKPALVLRIYLPTRALMQNRKLIPALEPVSNSLLGDPS
jgi:hypothetical protein